MSQREMIRDYLLLNGSITPLEALNRFGCFRLGARVWELRHEGLPIQKAMVEANGKRFAKYYLNEKDRLAGGTAKRREG